MSHEPPTFPKSVAPLEAAEALKPPSKAAAQRALALMHEVLGGPDSKLPRPPADAPTRPERVCGPTPHGPRLYPVAIAYFQSLNLPDSAPHSVAPRYGAEAAAPSWPSQPRIRPGIRRPAPAEAIPQTLLEQTVEALQLRESSWGTAAFQLVLREDALGPVTCEIRAEKSGFVARFWAEDAHTRRLLQAESGRLRAQLEDKGLSVGAIEIGPLADGDL